MSAMTSDANATEFLERYVSASAARLQWLRDLAAGTGGPRQWDYSRESLVPLWAWAITRFRLRGADEDVEPGRVPMWYGREPAPAPHWWSDETLALIDALAYYFGECLLRAIPGSRWEVGHKEDVATWRNEGQPVVADNNPVLVVTGLVGRVYVTLRPDENPYRVPAATPGDLQDALESLVRLTALARGQRPA
jgi:hypothetical protein